MRRGSGLVSISVVKFQSIAEFIDCNIQREKGRRSHTAVHSLFIHLKSSTFGLCWLSRFMCDCSIRNKLSESSSNIASPCLLFIHLAFFDGNCVTTAQSETTKLLPRFGRRRTFLNEMAVSCRSLPPIKAKTFR